jgi:dihydropteroate synthase
VWEISGRGWKLRWDRPIVMGVLNVTPDSFSDGGRYADVDAAVVHGLRLVRDGAAIVDVGGESTRPGATPVPLDVEINRVVPVITALSVESDAVISVDTRHAPVAEAAIAAGARIVNDVTGLRSADMVAVCASAGVPAVVMHMLGDPTTMQIDPHYDDVVGEVAAWLAAQCAVAAAAGVPSTIIDPGIGFGKLLEHNLALLDAIDRLGDAPVLVGASRKRFIGELSGVADPLERDPGTIAAHLHAVRRGAAIVRAHDVAGHVQALAVAAAWAPPDAPTPN